MIPCGFGAGSKPPYFLFFSLFPLAILVHQPLHIIQFISIASFVHVTCRGEACVFVRSLKWFAIALAPDTNQLLCRRLHLRYIHLTMIPIHLPSDCVQNCSQRVGVDPSICLPAQPAWTSSTWSSFTNASRRAGTRSWPSGGSTRPCASCPPAARCAPAPTAR